MVKYFTPTEVSLHNSRTDIWVSYLDDDLIKPILAAAGTDISHWFDPKTGDLKTHIDPITLTRVPYTPHGRFLHVPPPYPTSDWPNDFVVPWWKDKRYQIGKLTKKARTIKITNALTRIEDIIEVCSEETMLAILDRYLQCNAHAASYTWKYANEVLDLDKTLEENGISDQDDMLEELLLNVDDFIPEILLYYNDDLTEA
ncbi:unnamed protein product [Rodentolepis nana]|uniref:Cytochrome b5 heme-binding domain-containing protein n=1 Tax=Rodentolepis nana TaxID=102285 RepID=A0A0R3TMH1_RODNA|nr:unnamed protein product [Rodentolepis nana]